MKRIVTLILLLLCCAAFGFGGISFVTTSLPTAQVGVAYYQAVSVTGYTGSVTFSVVAGSLPTGFVLDQFLGVVCTGTVSSGSATCNTTPQVSGGGQIFTIQASDAGTHTSATFQFSITVLGASAPSITSSSPMPNAVVGQAYSFTFAESGGQAPYTWSEASTSVAYPPGFSLDPATGIFSSPQVSGSGTYTFLIQVGDTNGLHSSPKQFSLTISASGLTITTTSPLPSGSVGVPYNNGSGVQLVATGGTAYTWGLTGNGILPPPLQLSSSGLISGTPATTGLYQFQVEVLATGVSSGSNLATATFTISVVSSQLSIVQTTLPFAIQNASYSTTISAQGGAQPYTWSLGVNNVNGIGIGSSTGVLSGVPTNAPGAYSVQVNVRDSAGGSYSYTFSLTIAGGLSVSTTSLVNGVSGQAYSTTVNASGGQAPYSWSITGSLPPGLTLTTSAGSSVTISGTPTTNGIFQFTIKVVDSGSRTASQQLSIQVGNSLSITTTSLPAGAQGVTYNQVLGASGGQQPFTWSLSGGALPVGLTLNTNPDSTATINGNPTGQGASTFQLQVKDSQGNVATQSYTINIGVPLIITTVAVANGTVGVAYSQPLGANGGTPPYNWSVVSGSLPSGVTLNSSNGLISGNPSTAGSSNFTVNVADSSGASAQRAYSITVIAGLSLQTGNVTGSVSAALSFSLTASGGVPPYTFAIRSGSLPAGVNFNGNTGQFSGTPTAPGATSVAVVVTDSSGATATANVSFNIALNTPPPLTVGSFAATPLSQPAISLTLGGTFAVPLTGTMVLTFGSSVGGDDTTVNFTNGSRSVQFSIAAGSTTATFPTGNFGVITGTVAGTITLRVTQLLANGNDVTPSTLPQTQVVISPSAPVIRAVTCAAASGALTVSVTGYTTTRSMLSGTFTFTAPSGTTLQTNRIEVDQPLASAFTTWFGSSAANSTGGQFTLTMPFTLTPGTATGIGVTAGLGNSIGGSNTLTATCQ